MQELQRGREKTARKKSVSQFYCSMVFSDMIREEMSERNQLIDSLRGFSMIVIIFTHATVFFPSDRFVSALWNWSNFAVPIFIFCSVYLFLKKSDGRPIPFFTYLKKRFLRLLIPYYIFLPFFILVLWLISSDLLSIKYLFQSILVIGGVDINWLVLLFLYLTIMLPFFVWSQKKSPILFWFLFVLSFGSSIFLLFQKIDIPYKYTMWLPWSLMLYFTWFYIKSEQNKKVLLWLFFGCLSVFFVVFALQVFLAHSTILVHNKYPPNLLYISYGTSVLLGLVFLDNYLFRTKVILAIVNFFSRYSYSMYFLHYLVLTFFVAFMEVLGFTWITLFLAVMITTVGLQYFYNKFLDKRIRKVFTKIR